MTGGQTKKRADKIMALLGRIGYGDPFEGLPLTNHGESRIPNCVKYNLGDGWRLVTQQTDKACIFVYVGDHEDVDRWLNNHGGFQAGVKDRLIISIPGVSSAMTYAPTPHAGTKLIERLDEDLLDRLLDGVPQRVVRALDRLDGLARPDEIEQALCLIEDISKRELVRTVLKLVISGNVDGAEDHIKLDCGLVTPLEDVPSDQMLDIEDGAGIRRIRIGSADYEAWRKSMETKGAWQEWHLYLHPEQDRVYIRDFPGTAQLSGVSGSGKTCVVVRRALRLAERPDARVLLLTLNRSLAGLLSNLVDAACLDDEVRTRIEVSSYFDIARSLLMKFESEKSKYYDDVTYKLNEHVDEVYREFYRRWANNNDASVLFAQHKTMVARGVNGEAYIREEFDWLRSVLMPSERSRYLDLTRSGRRFPIVKERRQDILDGLQAWEAKMAAVGVADYLGVTMALAPYLEQIEPAYTNVLLDEAQDFGTTELGLVRRLVGSGPNDIFLCGDVAQTILPKHRSLTEAGFGKVEACKIQQNYRNSREILAAAYDVLLKNLHEEMLHADDLEILDPRYANFSGLPPLALGARDLNEEIALAITYARARLDTLDGARTACIAFAGFSQRDISSFASRCDYAVLDGRYDPRSDALVLSDLEQTKGYEFDLLIIVNCCDGVLPAADAPEEEAYRDTCKLYVAMTRARHELVLSYHGAASPWIRDVDASMLAFSWTDIQTISDDVRFGIPERLPEVEIITKDDLDINGVSFLYTDKAIGLSPEAQDKIVELVDGRGVKSAGRWRIKWPTLSALVEDMKASRRPDAQFGPVVGLEVRKVLIGRDA